MADDKTPRDLLDWLGIKDAPHWCVARPLGGLVAMLLGLLFAMAFAAAFVIVGRSITGGDGGGMGRLGAGALIVALLGAPFLIWSTVLKHQTLRYQKEGHITDRINKAVEQLGAEKDISRVMRNVRYRLDGREFVELEGKDDNFEPPEGATKVKRGDWEVVKRTVPNIEVRIGAILSLERIAQDSTRYDKGRDHVRVMEILCAYIRENAPARSAKDHEFGEWEPLKDDPTDEERAAHLEKRKARFGRHHFEGKVLQWARSLPEPRADIAKALRVIGRRSAAQRLAEARWGKDAGENDRWVFDTPCPSLPDEATPKTRAGFAAELANWRKTIRGYKGYTLDLRRTNLQSADLSDLVLSGANLQGARMEGANLRRARIERANLSRARIEGAYLHSVRMEGAVLWSARMEGANLISARMEGAALNDARMEGAALNGAQMEGTDLNGAQMEWANLNSARMEGAKLWAVWLEGADLRGARLEGADLRYARFDASTKWTGALLHGASVRFVDFTGTSITADQIETTFGDATTLLPDTIPRPAHWPEG